MFHFLPFSGQCVSRLQQLTAVFYIPPNNMILHMEWILVPKNTAGT